MNASGTDVAAAQQGSNVLQDIDQAGNQFLTFMLEEEEYAVDILRVHEIKGWTPVTPLPNAPAFLKGVINLRGTIVPIIDLRERFGMASKEYGPTTVVIVLNVNIEGREQVMGIVVDAVSDTYTISAEQLQPAPEMTGAISGCNVTGLASIGDNMVIVLDIDHLLNTAEMEALNEQ